MATSIYNFTYDTFKDSKEVKTKLNKFFGNRVNSFGVGAGLCAKWVRVFVNNVLNWEYNPDLDTEVVGSAWNLFAHIIDNEITYLDTIAFGKENNFTNEDLKKIGVKNGSFLFGYYKTSNYLRDSVEVIQTYGTQEKINQLTRLRNRKTRSLGLPFNPISHIGVFYNDQFYHLIKSNFIHQNPTASFYPVAYWDCIDRFIQTYDNNV